MATKTSCHFFPAYPRGLYIDIRRFAGALKGFAYPRYAVKTVLYGTKVILIFVLFFCRIVNSELRNILLYICFSVGDIYENKRKKGRDSTS